MGNFKNECPEMCPRILAPVCGSNGVSYGNKCEFERAKCESNQKLFVVHNGSCDSKTSVQDCPLFCNRMLRPVCGSDNHTYSNRCLLKVASCQEPSTNLFLKHEGVCEDPINDENHDNHENAPDNVTLNSEIKLKKNGIDCPSFCHRMFRPVCGSNNVTYSNECFLKRTACQNPAENILLKSIGACESMDLQTDNIEFSKSRLSIRMISKNQGTECPKFCNRIRSPVCGSDNKTYTNACVLKRRSCSRPSLNLIIRASGS